MKTIEEMVDVMNHYEMGGEIEYKSIHFNSDWLTVTNPNWSWGDVVYRKKEHQYEVGDWVEVVENHCLSRVGEVVQITEIDSVGDIWAKGWIIENDPDQHESDDVCKIKPASKPEPTYRPFTAETFPKGVVWMKAKHFPRQRGLVINITEGEIQTANNKWTYSEILEDCEISLDGGETWQKAGEEVK